MSKSINNNNILSKDSYNRENNKNEKKILQSNEKEQKKSEKTIPNLNPKIFVNINSSNNNSLLEGESIGQQNNDTYHIRKISNPITDKKLIFNIRKIKKEKQRIEIIKKEKNKEINLEEIQFKIGFVIKGKIKVKDIINLSVENFLNLDEEKNSQQNDNISNKKRLEIIRTFLGSLLDNFFETRVISLFKIYIKKKEKIDLKKYGIQGIVLKLPKNMKTFKKLKEKQKNREKIQKMNKLINSEFINPKKRRLRKIFKTKKE